MEQVLVCIFIFVSTACGWLVGALRNRQNLIEHLIDDANTAADAMEGAAYRDFIKAEERMCHSISLLQHLGVNYDPITGKRESI